MELLVHQVLCVDFFERVGCRKVEGKEGKGWLDNYFAQQKDMRVGNPLVGIGRSEKRWEEKKEKTMNISYCTIIIK